MSLEPGNLETSELATEKRTPFEDGLQAEHWDVLQDEATQAESVSSLPMFGKSFPS
jgi:hypothetical protein